MKNCPICNKKHQNKNTPICSSCCRKYYKFKTKLSLIKLLGGKCKKCGFLDIECLEFHHIDPAIKSFKISEGLVKKYDYTILVNEANKCILLCSNCHKKEHYKDASNIVEYFQNPLISKPDNKKYNIRPLARKVNRPSKEILAKEVFEMTSIELGKKYGVSDRSIGKWCKWYNIPKPSRGYWSRKKDNLSII